MVSKRRLPWSLRKGRKVVKKMRKTRLTLYLQEIREHGAVFQPW